jgi:hypothetical protein
MFLQFEGLSSAMEEISILIWTSSGGGAERYVLAIVGSRRYTREFHIQKFIYVVISTLDP